MYSGLRKRLSEPKISHPSYFVGLLLRSCVLPHPNYGHVVLAKPSPILFYPISSTEVLSSSLAFPCRPPPPLPPASRPCTPARLRAHWHVRKPMCRAMRVFLQ